MASSYTIILRQPDHQLSCSSRKMSYQAAIEDSDVVDGLSVRYLKFFGLWGVINDYRTMGKRNATIKFKLAVTILLEFPYVFSQYLSYFIIEVDIQKATFFNLHSVPGLQMCCRIIVFWFKMESQCRLYNLIRKDFLYIPEYMRSDAEKIFKKITKMCNRLCMAAFIVNVSIVIVSIIDPGISIEYITSGTGSMAAVPGGKKKILCAWYPLPMDQSLYYEAIFIYESILISWGGVFLAVYACLFYQVLMCLYAQIVVLGHHMSTLKVEAIANKKVQYTKDEMYKELYGILKDHQKLLSYSDELRGVYNPLVTMILGMGIFVLITAVFQFLFGKTGNPMIIFKSLQFLTYQAIEVCMFCFGSSYIEGASSDLQFAIYNSDWYKADLKFRKAAQMLMIRSKRAETLTAIRMYPVNVETIMAILQFTYSVTALLSRMTE